MKRAACLAIAMAVGSACARRDPGAPQPYPYAHPYPAPHSYPSPYPYPQAPPPQAPTFASYARLDRLSCEAELGRRGIAWARANETPGVLAPVRLRGPLAGVSVHSGLPAAQRERSHNEIVDCRLVLALHDFAAIVASRGVVEMIHMSAYRPQSENGCTPRYVGKQHCAALAIDVGYFKRSDGTTLNVEKDFHGRIGQATCSGYAAPQPPTPIASELWGWVCEAARRRIFNVILTPNHDAQHKNHFHLEIMPDAEWMMIK
ncbi:MAG: extensin family protein [Labilithrix sp.]|nr:extensin family protein [Labilithrix sp.]